MACVFGANKPASFADLAGVSTIVRIPQLRS